MPLVMEHDLGLLLDIRKLVAKRAQVLVRLTVMLLWIGA